MTEYESVTAELNARAERGETIAADMPGSEFIETVYCDEVHLQNVVAFNVSEGWAEFLRFDKEPVGDELPREKVYGRIVFTFAPGAPR